MKINEWVKEVHQVAKDHGWWENPREEEEVAMLMITEVAEATESVRSKEPAIWQMSRDGSNRVLPGAPAWEAGIKPEGEAIELADLLIRLADWVGNQNWDLEKFIQSHKDYASVTTLNEFANKIKTIMGFNADDVAKVKPLNVHFRMVEALVSSVRAIEKNSLLLYVDLLEKVVAYMVIRGWDVEEAISLKMAYNKTRSYRHGGKAA